MAEITINIFKKKEEMVPSHTSKVSFQNDSKVNQNVDTCGKTLMNKNYSCLFLVFSRNLTGTVIG